MCITPEENGKHGVTVGDMLAFIGSAETQDRLVFYGSYPESKGCTFADGRITMNSDTDTIYADGKPAGLTAKETQLVSVLGIQAGQIVSYEKLMAGMRPPISRVALNKLISRTRISLGPELGKYIETVHGMGLMALITHADRS